MRHAIARLFVPLLRPLVPAPGRHRRAEPSPAAAPPVAPPTARLPRVPAPRVEDIGLVRPYVVAHERRLEAWQRRARGRVLWLAVHGVDAGPRWIHGAEATAC